MNLFLKILKQVLLKKCACMLQNRKHHNDDTFKTKRTQMDTISLKHK
jgi:hypothetical protein